MKKLLGLALGALLAVSAIGVSSSAEAQPLPVPPGVGVGVPFTPGAMRGYGRGAGRRLGFGRRPLAGRRLAYGQLPHRIARAPFRGRSFNRFGSMRRERGAHFRGYR